MEKDAKTYVADLILNNKVVIFSKSYCPYCIQVKELFDKLSVPYAAVEIDKVQDGPAIMEVLVAKTGQKTVPNVFVGGNHVGGCDSTLKAHADGQLMKMINGPGQYDYDLVVIGGGSGGLAASKEAAQFGRRVAVCDFVVPSPAGTTWGLGGTCVNVGCIPKKLMHQAALLGTSIQDAGSFGWMVSDKVTHDWEKMSDAIQGYIRSLNWGYRVSLKEKNVTYLNSYAQFVDGHTIKCTDKKGKVTNITAEHFIIAVGGRPSHPPNLPGAQLGISSDDLFWLPHSPGKTLLIGASYIALECAGFLHGLGLDVTVMVRSILLRGFDRQMAEMIGDHMKGHGIKFIEECVPQQMELESDGPPKLIKVTGLFRDGSTYKNTFNTVVFAVGRTACTSGIGLESLGMKVHSNGKIIADEKEQSSIKNIFAIGDVLHEKPELTPVAIQAGKLLARRMYTNSTVLTDYANIPTTVFTPLEYGCIGLSEEDAVDKYGADDVEVYHSHFQPLEFALPGRDANKPYAKLVCVKSEDERVVGFHVLGPNAGEITQGYAIGLKLGAKKADFAAMVGIHPTCAEIFTTMSVTKASGVNVDKTSC